MSRTTLSIAAVFSAMLFMLPDSSLAAPLLRDQMTSGAGWGMNSITADVAATFGYDYSADGIPEAPHSLGADDATTGVKLEANLMDGALTGFTLYPTGKSFSGNYSLRFDAWMNWDTDAGFAGTTEFLGGGVGYDNVTADVASGAQTITTGDGGSSNDWRAFKSPPQFFIAAADMAGGSRNGGDPYYANFLPAIAPPASQSQGGTGVAGSPGFQWITWEFAVNGSNVDVTIEKPNGDRLPIVSMDCSDTSDGSGGCSTSGNISLFYADFFSSVSSRPDLTFGVIDNVEVVPEPATLSMMMLGFVGFLASRRR